MKSIFDKLNFEDEHSSPNYAGYVSNSCNKILHSRCSDRMYALIFHRLNAISREIPPDAGDITIEFMENTLTKKDMGK
jgi:hypothetical protein